MGTSNLNPNLIFNSYSHTAGTASKAVLADAINLNSVADDTTAIVAGKTLKFLPANRFDGDAAVAATGEAVVVATTGSTSSQAELTVSGGFPDGSTVAVGALTLASNSGTPGANEFLYTAGDDNANATAIAAAIDGEGTYSASAVANVVTVTADPGVNTDVTTSSHASLTWGGNLSGGQDVIGPAIGNTIVVATLGGATVTITAAVAEDTAVGTATFITTTNAANKSENEIAQSIVACLNNDPALSASRAGNTITITQASAGAFSGGVTVIAPFVTSTGFANGQDAVAEESPTADEILIKRQGGTPGNKNKTKLAINGASGDVDIKYGSNIGSTANSEGINGYNAKDGTGTGLITLEAEESGANTLATSAANHTVDATNSGSSLAGSFSIDLDDLTSGLNELTDAEASGDYRKLAYHLLKTMQGYLDNQESITGITASGGTGYLAGGNGSIALNFTGGGGSGATGSVNVIAGVPGAVTVSNPGSGYTSDPTVSIVDSAGTGNVFVVTRSTNTPDNFDVVKGFISENANGTMTRSYTVSFTFAGENLDVAPE